jgi:rhamnogalacturonyl hydrolase YesR
MFKEKNESAVKADAAVNSALRGLDFFVRSQINDPNSGDAGRFPYVYDCAASKITTLTTNWTTGVTVSALLSGYKLTGSEEYLTAAGKACRFIKSLQDFNPRNPQTIGLFHENCPQTEWAHPRDALTAAWALLDYSLAIKDEDGIERAKAYANWFIDVALKKGYPLWTVRFDDKEWEPSWCGSFHSGSAFFMYRMYEETGDKKFEKAMRQILDFYNEKHLDDEGRITVIIDRNSLESLDGKADKRFTNPGWEMMHRYNDDFGALANLAAWKTTEDEKYREYAEKFLLLMCRSQRNDGGFGPAEWGVPSAAGAILIEIVAAKRLGISRPEYDLAAERAMKYILKLQNNAPKQFTDGAFFGMTDNYEVSSTDANTRTAAYAIMALLHYGGANDNIYSFIKK